MKSEIWSKTLLKSYELLQYIEENIDKRVEILAFSQTSIRYGNTTKQTCEKIISLIERKKQILHLHAQIDNMLDLIEKKYATILKAKYVHNLSYEDIAKKINVCERTVRRYIQYGIKQFTEVRNQNNFTDKDIINNYGKEPFLLNMYIKTMQNYLRVVGDKEYYKFYRKVIKHHQNNYQKIYNHNLVEKIPA